MRFGAWRRAGIALGAILLAIAPAATQGPASLVALSRLQPGLWSFRDLDGAGPPRSICLGDPNLLIQLEHRGLPCARLVIENDERIATIHYTCPAGGYGRTSIRVETARLAVVDTQGIADSRPFAYRLQGRRTGPCR